MGWAHYDPNTGRWLSRDPYSEIDGANLYSYVHQNPIGNFDSYGLLTDSVSQAIKSCWTKANYCDVFHCLRITFDTIAIPPQDRIGVDNLLAAYEKYCQLPLGKGQLPFNPKKEKGKKCGEVPTDKKGNPLDDKDRPWVWDDRKKEWDVQDPGAPRGKNHYNVNSDGDITHPK